MRELQAVHYFVNLVYRRQKENPIIFQEHAIHKLIRCYEKVLHMKDLLMLSFSLAKFDWLEISNFMNY